MTAAVVPPRLVSPRLVRRLDYDEPQRVAVSALAPTSPVTDLDDFLRRFRQYGRQAYTAVDRVALDRLDGWSRHPTTGNIGHRSGKFFTVEGLGVHIPGSPVPTWDQPIINQPEVGILGILVKEFDGVLHCLMQAKVEPGNANGLQLSPTVQATRSNYTGVHGGKAVPYLRYFKEAANHHILSDVRQSEQGSWFNQKRNRNMVVETTEDVELLDGFYWLTIGQVHTLLGVEDLINMDARTVLSGLPFAGATLSRDFSPGGDDFRRALRRSCDEEAGSLHSREHILSWITEERTRHDVHTAPVPLADVKGWRRTEDRISHDSGRFFDVIGVHVTAAGREVSEWTQPMIEPFGLGIIAFLVREIEGVLHALVYARVEPGYFDVVELAPTVQCTPENYAILPAEATPPFLAEVLGADEHRVRYDTILSEEGGRFYHARNRYLVVETDVDAAVVHPDYRWMALHQLVDLLRHSHYLNVQARSLVACLHSLYGAR
jgi:oxidase EvaA